jgi:serine/threonine protein kinase
MFLPAKSPREFPTFDGRLDAYVQRSFDYMAPEYALDEVLDTASDLYALGCLLFAVHRKGDPPFRNHGSLSGLRDNAGKPVPNLNSLDADLQGSTRSGEAPLLCSYACASPAPPDDHPASTRPAITVDAAHTAVLLLAAHLYPQLSRQVPYATTKDCDH